jgi:ferritin-like metal-binding protein YciE
VFPRTPAADRRRRQPPVRRRARGYLSIIAPSTEKRLLSYLTDMHSVERQALVQMKLAPRLVGGRMADDFQRHCAETQGHLDLVGARLRAHQAEPSSAKDAAGWIGGVGMALFARLQPDTPGKLAFHAHSYENMELAAYRLLERVAQAAGDPETAAAARRIGDEEEAMAERIVDRFDQAVDDSLNALGDGDPAAHLDTYLADMHALERQSTRFLEAARGHAEAPALAAVFEAHLEETLVQSRRLEERLAERGASTSRLKDTALGLGGVNLAGFFAAQPDPPPKLAGFAFAFEQLEVGGYALLARVAARAGDEDTVALAAELQREERTAAAAVAGAWDAALATLGGVEVSPAHA